MSQSVVLTIVIGILLLYCIIVTIIAAKRGHTLNTLRDEIKDHAKSIERAQSSADTLSEELTYVTDTLTNQLNCLAGSFERLVMLYYKKILRIDLELVKGDPDPNGEVAPLVHILISTSNSKPDTLLKASNKFNQDFLECIPKDIFTRFNLIKHIFPIYTIVKHDVTGQQKVHIQTPIKFRYYDPKLENKPIKESFVIEIMDEIKRNILIDL